MLDTEISGPQGFLAPTYFPPSGGESGDDDEELSVLPRHTKVVVRGNNRTKSVLVGLQGVVKKAVGLGGWHWLVLTNGVEVKLQRNALTVIEPPTGQEEDDEIEIPFCNDSVIDDFPRTFKPRVRPQKPAKATESLHTPESAPKQQSSEKKTESVAPPASLPTVDLSKLETAALRKYRKHFKLCDVGPNSSKEQLLRAIGKHFISHLQAQAGAQHIENSLAEELHKRFHLLNNVLENERKRIFGQLNELEVITGFLQAAKRAKT